MRRSNYDEENRRRVAGNGILLSAKDARMNKRPSLRSS